MSESPTSSDEEFQKQYRNQIEAGGESNPNLNGVNSTCLLKSPASSAVTGNSIEEEDKFEVVALGKSSTQKLTTEKPSDQQRKNATVATSSSSKLASCDKIKSSGKMVIIDPIPNLHHEKNLEAVEARIQKELDFRIPNYDCKHANRDIFWYPWPKKGQKVPLPESLRRLDDEGKDDPFKYHCCHPWWCSFICCGADRDTLTDMDRTGKLEELCKLSDWEYPPIGREKVYDVNRDIEIFPDLKAYGRSKITVNNLYDYIRLPKVLKFFWELRFTQPYLCVLTLFLVVPPALWIILLFGLPDWGIPTQCNSLGFASVWAVFSNPMSEVTIAFCHAVLMFNSLDDTLAWRPARHYFLTLVAVYLTQVALFLPLALTHTAVPVLGLVSQFLRLIVELIGFQINRRNIIYYQPGRESVNYDLMQKRFSTFQKYIIFEFILVAMYTGYLYGIKTLGGPAQTGLNLGFTFITTLCRVYLQRLTSIYHKDVGFILSFVLVYGLKASFTAFLAPNFGSNVGAYISSAITPLTTVIFCFLHQADMWFRFRCYIKKGHFAFAKHMPLQAWPVEEDVDFQSRGNYSDHPGYRRVKIHNDVIEIYAQLSGYFIYLITVPVLRYGWNKDNFPYSAFNPFLQETVVDGNFEEGDFRSSVYFSLLNCAYLIIGLLLFTSYMKYFYPKLVPVYMEFLSVFWRHSWKLGALLMTITIVNISVIKMTSSYARIWWVDEPFYVDCS